MKKSLPAAMTACLLATFKRRRSALVAVLFCAAPATVSAQVQIESNQLQVGSAPVTVNLSRVFASPVVVCTPRYANNSVPIVPRVSNVTTTSFDVRLENPSGNAIASEWVDYLVVEEGTWTIGGVAIEAQKYLSTTTDNDFSWVGEAQAYGQGYTNPVVLGQVMTENDSSWSVFWCRGSASSMPPTAVAIFTGKTVCEDPDTTRVDETVGFVVIGAGHGVLAGVEYEADVGADTVLGMDNGPPFTYTFNTAFPSAPQISMVTVAGMDGNNGAWAVLYGATPLTATTMDLATDEDQLVDPERTHTDEQVGYLVFQAPVLYPNTVPDNPIGLSLSECPQGGGTDKTPTLGFTQADDDSDDVFYRIQIDDTDNTFSSLVVDYTSASVAGGAASFTVGQAAGSGSYTVGSAGQELPADTYFWRVQSSDGYATSGWANGVSFSVVEPTIDFSSATYSGGEAGGAITLTVELSADSCETITVDYDSSNGTATAPADYTAVSSTLTFSPGDTSKTFNVVPVNDPVDEANETVTLTLSSPTDATLAGGNNPATVTINDDDVAGITLTESAGSTDVSEGGANDTYTLVLDTRPVADVTITITPDAQSDLGGGAGTAIQKVFTSGNWSTAQVVTVAATNDDVDEDAHTSTITHVVTSADGNYNAFGVGNVTANITDNDTAGVTITESGGSTEAAESGATDAYTVVLDSEPTANVVITIDPDGATDLGSGAGVAVQLTFTAGNWDTPQSVTVAAIDDDVDQGTHTSTITHTAASADGKYNGIGIGNLVADILDDDTAGVTVTEGGGTTAIAEGGATDTYTIELDSEPVNNVVITLTPDSELDLGSGAGVAIQFTFTAGDWDTPQTATVTAVDDAIDEGVHTGAITHSAASTDTNYGGIAIGGVTASITDNDTADITITESAGSTDVTEGGATDTYTIVLESRPTANVTVTVDPDGQTDLGGGPGTAVDLIFSPANWSAAQTVTVTAVDDVVAEGVHTSTISHTVASVDGNYDGFDLSGDDVSATITDNDSAGVTITESAGATSVIETGATDTYTIVLDTKPTATVTITVDPDDQSSVGAGRDTPVDLTFTTANWSTPQVVVVTAYNDFVDEGGHTSTITHTAASTDGVYDGIAINDVVANVGDDDVAGITISESGGNTAATEGGATDTYTVVLDSEPTANVVVTIMPDGQSDLGSGAGVAIALTFTNLNWAAARTVTVTADDDDVDEDLHNSTISHASASADTDYDAMPISDVIAALTDNDTAGVTITESGGSTDVAEGGATDTYTVVLDSEPVAAVTVTLDPDPEANLGAGIGAPVQFTFNAGNWDTPQTATVTAVDDFVDDDPNFATIVHSVSSVDGKYDGMDLSGSNVVANVTDDDVAGITITESAASTDVTEGGATDTYTIVLDSQPVANVRIYLDPDTQGNLGLGAGVAIQRTFTPGTWSTPRTITVAAANDYVDEDAHTSTITHDAVSTDAKYDGMVAANVVANVTDNDTAGITVTETGGGTAVTEGGATDTYSIVLQSQPVANVTITVTPDGQTDLGAGAGTAIQVVLTGANWWTPHPVVVTAYQDDVDEGAHTSTITHVVTSPDPKYDGMGLGNIVSQVFDNDTAGVSILEPNLGVRVPEGGPVDAYSVVLDTEPVANVRINVDPDTNLNLGAGFGTAIDLDFNASDWNVPQVVSAMAFNDTIEVGDIFSTITHTATSADPKYNGLLVRDLVALILEDDAASVIVTQSDGSTLVGEGGATDSYTLVLDTEPERDVYVYAQPDSQSDVGRGAGKFEQFTFTPADWSTPQTVTVSADNDANIEGTHFSFIIHSVVSGDDAYDGLAVDDVRVTIIDNDGGGGGGGGGGSPGDNEPPPDDSGDDDPDDQQPPPPPDDGDSPDDPEPLPDDGESPALSDLYAWLEPSLERTFIGDNVRFTLRMENRGDGDATDVKVVVWLAEIGELHSAQLVANDSTRDWPLAALDAERETSTMIERVPAGATMQLEMLVRPIAPGDLAMECTITSADGELFVSARVEAEAQPEVVVEFGEPTNGVCGVSGLGTVFMFITLLTLRLSNQRLARRH